MIHILLSTRVDLVVKVSIRPYAMSPRGVNVLPGALAAVASHILLLSGHMQGSCLERRVKK